MTLGTLADAKLRTLRNEAHKHFDRLHQSGLMSREDAYAWLADIIQAPMSKAHIGNLTEYYCHVVIDESDKLFENRKNRTKRSFQSGTLQGGELYVVV